MALQILFYVFLFTIGTCQHANVDDADSEPLNSLLVKEEPRDVVAAKGSPALLECGLSGSNRAAANLTWFHNGQPLPVPDPRRTVLHNGSLLFEKVLHKRSGRNSSDEGMYHCSLTTDAGVIVSRNASLRIAGLAQEFHEVPLDAAAEEGDAARFECQINSLPEPEITWEKDDRTLETLTPRSALNATGNIRFVALPNGVLHIHGVRASDAGRYRCVAFNPVLGKSRRSPEGNLTVTPKSDSMRPPRFLMDDSSTANRRLNKIIVKDGEVILECLASGNPPPAITWTVNSTNIDDTPVEIYTRPGYLHILKADDSTTGIYNCSASDNSTTISRTTELRTAVPAVIVTAPRSQVFPTAKTVRFDCEVAGYPLPTIRWFKDGRSLNGDGRIIQRLRNGGTLSELVLSNTVTTDSGLYQCVAQNMGGFSSSVARLLVNVSEGRPEPPFKLQTNLLSSSRMLLSWNPPTNVPVSDITAYTVHYMLAGGSKELTEVALNNSFMFDRLLPNTSYSFYVRAYSTKSASDPSERITVTTLPENLASHWNVSLTPLNPTSLKVSWFTSSDSQHGLLKIQYRLHNEEYVNMEPVRNGATEYVITGLHPGKKYDVRVLSGPPLDSQAPWSTQEMPRRRSSAPVLHLTSTDQRSILVTWEERKQATSYKLLIRKAGGRFQEQATVPSTDPRTYLVQDLNADTNYDVQLVAYGENGEGPASVRSIRTLGDADDSDADATYDDSNVALKVESVTSRSAKVSWQLEAGNIDIAFFTVRYSDESTRYVRTTMLEAELENLKPFATYQVSLQYHDGRGRFSSFSPQVEFRTLPDVPSAPLRLTASSDGTNVTLSWQPPLETNGIIISYEVLYTDNVALNVEQWYSVEESGHKYRTLLQNLVEAKTYYVKVRAKNEAGYGSLTDVLQIEVRTQPLEDFHIDSASDQQLGIIVGLALGVGVLFASTFVVLWRARCVKRAAGRLPRSPSGGSSPDGDFSANPEAFSEVSVNGLRESTVGVKKAMAKGNRRPTEELVTTLEMETLTPILSNIPPYTNDHLDTKGGYPTLPTSGGASDRPETMAGRLGHSSSHSSLQSMAGCSDEGRISANSSRSWSDDNDTGICSVGPYRGGGSDIRYGACLSANPVRESNELVT